MSANGITNVMTPTLAKSAVGMMGDITITGSWKNTFNGDEVNKFIYMDTVFFLDGVQHFSNSGDSERESDKFSIARRTFYPYSNWKVYTCDIKIRGVYEGAGRWGDFMNSPVLQIGKPNPPKIEMSIVTENGQDWLKVEVTPDAGDSYREVADTIIRISEPSEDVYGPVRSPGGAVATFTATDSKSYVWKKKVSEIKNALTYGGSIAVSATAYSRGMSGDGPGATVVRYFAYPNVPTIVGVGINADQVMLNVRSNATTNHPTSTMELQVVKTAASFDKVQANPNSYSWETVKTVGGESTTIFDTLQNAKADLEPGMHVYYRVRSKYDDNERFSTPFWVKELDVPKMSVVLGSANIFSAVSGDNGTSVRVDIAWNDETLSNVDEAELEKYEFATEVSWATSEHAWESTGGASEFVFDWEDATPNPDRNLGKPAGVASYKRSGRVYIDNLEEGVPVFIRARRMQTCDGKTTFGEYSSTVMVTPVSAPAWVRLEAPSYVARGESVPLTWMLGTEAEQTGWIVSGAADPQLSIEGWAAMDDDQRKAALDEACVGFANGSDATGYAILDAAKVPASASVLHLKCAATTGGLYTDSEYVPVNVADAPECSLENFPAVVDGLPLMVDVEATAGARVALSIVSRGITYATPTGNETQYVDDIVWSGSAIGGTQVGIFDAPLIDGCAYELRATAIDASTGLKSTTVAREFAVAFERDAPYPEASVVVDEDAKSATIVTAAPEGAADGDVCDVYRVSLDSVELIASDVAFGSRVRDRFAPFVAQGSELSLSYRVATRTPDGSQAWRDFPFRLEGYGIRLDWADRSLWLPYNVSPSGSVGKSFEARDHMSGRIDGFWDPACPQNSSLRTEMIRFADAEQMRAVFAMAKHPGAVFVRTEDGQAYDANVVLSSIDESYDRVETAVSLDAERIALTDAHRCGVGDVVAP